MAYQIFIRLARDIWDAEPEVYANRADAVEALAQMHASFKSAGITDVPKSDYKIKKAK